MLRVLNNLIRGKCMRKKDTFVFAGILLLALVLSVPAFAGDTVLRARGDYIFSRDGVTPVAPIGYTKAMVIVGKGLVPTEYSKTEVCWDENTKSYKVLFVSLIVDTKLTKTITETTNVWYKVAVEKNTVITDSTLTRYPVVAIEVATNEPWDCLIPNLYGIVGVQWEGGYGRYRTEQELNITKFNKKTTDVTKEFETWNYLGLCGKRVLLLTYTDTICTDSNSHTNSCSTTIVAKGKVSYDYYIVSVPIGVEYIQPFGAGFSGVIGVQYLPGYWYSNGKVNIDSGDTVSGNKSVAVTNSLADIEYTTYDNGAIWDRGRVYAGINYTYKRLVLGVEGGYTFGGDIKTKVVTIPTSYWSAGGFIGYHFGKACVSSIVVPIPVLDPVIVPMP